MAIDLTKFNELVAAIVKDAEKANVKGNKSAAKRVRANTLELRKVIVELRAQALALYKTEEAEEVAETPAPAKAAKGKK